MEPQQWTPPSDEPMNMQMLRVLRAINGALGDINDNLARIANALERITGIQRGGEVH